MSSAACLSLQVGRSLRTIIGIRLQTRRCDCSFVLAVPVQTSWKIDCSEGVVCARPLLADGAQAPGAVSITLWHPCECGPSPLLWCMISAESAYAATAAITPGRYSSPVESTAHAMRTSLLGIATTSTLRGALASSAFIHVPMVKRSRFMRMAAARTPWISTLRR